MIRINLLPHREQKRKERKQLFFILVGVSFAVAGALAFGVHLFFSQQISAQQARNNFIKQENAKLDREIAEIRTLQEQINALLARKRVIEDLQSNRSETVMLFNELAAKMPEGVYIRSMRQQGQRLSMAGFSQSNARVSTLMRSLESSPVLGNPQLVEVKAATQANRRVAEFSLNISMVRPKAPTEDEIPQGGR